MSRIITSYNTQDEDNLVVQETQDVSSVLEDNLQERNSGENDQSGKVGRKFASIPMLVLESLKHTHGIDWHLIGQDADTTGKFFTWLREHNKWRTSEARVG